MVQAEDLIDAAQNLGEFVCVSGALKTCAVNLSKMGNDFAITMAAEADQLELNAFEPVLFYNLFKSIETFANATTTFVDNCIVRITANKERCAELLNDSME